jgi:hypothetical protein
MPIRSNFERSAVELSRQMVEDILAEWTLKEIGDLIDEMEAKVRRQKLH